MCAKKKEQMERGQKEKKRKEKAEHRKSTKDFIGDVEKEQKKKKNDRYRKCQESRSMRNCFCDANQLA